MSGFVTTRDILLHSSAIVREFGVACFLRCLRRIVCTRHRPVTFLECIPQPQRD